MITLYNLFPRKLKKIVTLFSAALSAVLFLLVDIYIIQAIYEELTLFNATSAALGIPVWIYYIGVPIFSIFVFTGIYRDASLKLDELKTEGGRPWK
jgi:TRAP-type C4-dicarboxylate transport system permease small subunit